MRIVREAPDDRAVLEGLERHAPGAGERMRGFSRRPSFLFRGMALALDLDEGYIGGRWVAAAQRVLVPVTAAVAGSLRRLHPLRNVPPRERD